MLSYYCATRCSVTAIRCEKLSGPENIKKGRGVKKAWAPFAQLINC
jgi:hypothetical protein